MRYVGQEHTLTVAAPGDGGISADADAIRERVLRRLRPHVRTCHRRGDRDRRRCGRRSGPNCRGALRRAAARRGRDAAPAASIDAWSFTRGERLPFALVDRTAIGADGLAGPAIVLEETATTYLDAEFHGRLGRGGILEIPTRGRPEMLGEPVVYRAGLRGEGRAADADPVTTEVIRHGLNSAAEAIKRTLIRTSMSPIIYEVLDFAAVLYDRRMRLLAQAPSLPFFMGTMSFCIEAAVEEVGGEAGLDPGDIILMNDPYKTGSHPQDAAVVMPVYLPDGRARRLLRHQGALARHRREGDLLHRHHRRLPGGRRSSPASSCTAEASSSRTSRRWRSRTRACPKFVLGDINAEVAGVRAGARELIRLVERYGLEVFSDCVERMYDHGEAVVRSYIEKLPDGRYIGRGVMDDDGISDEEIPFEVVLEIDGTTAVLDFSNAPAARPGPVNCPIASTVSAARVIMTMLAGGGEAPNEGHFRPIEVIARPGSMFARTETAAVLPVRMAGNASDRGGTQRGRRGHAGGGLRMLRRRPVRGTVVRRPGGHRPVLGRRISAPGRAGGFDPRRRPERPPAPRRGSNTVRTARGLGSQEPLADGVLRARTRLGWPGTQPGRPRTRHGLPLPRGRVRDLDDRAHEERALGARRRRRGTPELR